MISIEYTMKINIAFAELTDQRTPRNKYKLWSSAMKKARLQDCKQMDFLTSTGKAKMLLPKEVEFAVAPDGEWVAKGYKGLVEAKAMATSWGPGSTGVTSFKQVEEPMKRLEVQARARLD